MIRKLVRQMLSAQIISAMTVSLCLLIDNIMIGRFLKEDALSAYSLANPILLAIGGIGMMLSVGIQTACGKSLGRGSQEETNAGYSSAIALAGGISLVFLVVVVLLRTPIATIMGAGREGVIFNMTRDYLAGFSLGAPGSMGALVLVPFMQMAGKSGLLIVSVLSMTVADVVLDLLNVLVFHGGMFGMGLASSLSYYIAMLIGGWYFLSKKCVFRFSFKLVTMRKIAELFQAGIPAGFTMIASVLLIFFMNRIVRAAGGNSALAAYTVITTLGNTAGGINTGVGGVSLTLAGIFYNEEDRTSLKEVVALLCRYAVILGAAAGVLLLIFAPACVSLFIPEAGAAQDFAIRGLRIFAAGLIPCAVNAALRSAYQATDRVGLMAVISLAEGAALPVLVALVFRSFLGLDGVWMFYALGELLALICIGLMIFLRTRRMPWQGDAFLLLRRDFGVTPENLLERSLTTVPEVVDFAREAGDFCRRHGQSDQISSHISLCIEEMGANIVQHGFAADQKPHHLSVRVLDKDDRWVLRFRDDCRAFDPVQYVPGNAEDGLGIRLVMALAEEVNYTYSMNLNNLMLRLPENG